MLKTYLYIPDQIAVKIEQMARAEKKSKAAVVRQVLEKGIDVVKQQSNAGVEALFKIAELGKRYKVRGPKDSSKRMDEYLWDKDWSKDD